MDRNRRLDLKLKLERMQKDQQLEGMLRVYPYQMEALIDIVKEILEEVKVD